MHSHIELYKEMYRIRLFEETILDLFSKNKLFGTTHTYTGQEHIAVAAMNAIGMNDSVFSNHRSHGHFIAYSKCVDILLAEIMGKETGVCKGIGGSQHLCYKNFYSNGIQGGIVPNAAGIAWAEKLKQRNGIALCFIGDGTLGQGIVYETFNLSSLFSIPVLYIIENNQYAMSTKIKDALAGSISGRVSAFNIEYNETDSEDVEQLLNLFTDAVDFVRKNQRPFCQIVNTYRLSPHSKGDDFRDKSEVELHKKNDPLLVQRKKCTNEDIMRVEHEIRQEINGAISFAESSNSLDSADFEILSKESFTTAKTSLLNDDETMLNAKLRKAFEAVLGGHKNVLFLGEDICDPYGGAFKATKDLSFKFPSYVYNTPISEAGITGLAIGLAMNGIIPVVEIMFGDFLTLCFDQILNHASKYHQMYAGQKNTPLIIRTPMGGRRGYGPTHSQSIEKYISGIPNIQVISLSLLHDPIILWNRIIKHTVKPTIVIENKVAYGECLYPVKNGRFKEFFVLEENEIFPVIRLTFDPEENADAVIITYGTSLKIAIDAANKLMFEDEIMVDIIINTSINPLHYDYLKNEIRNVNLIVTLEEGTSKNCIGTEIISDIVQSYQNKRYACITAKETVIPCNKSLEDYVLPDTGQVISLIKGEIQ
jgi:2-oxoisovalerate dehydrogenase E1 component